jgi:hypothetical protein
MGAATLVMWRRLITRRPHAGDEDGCRPRLPPRSAVCVTSVCAEARGKEPVEQLPGVKIIAFGGGHGGDGLCGSVIDLAHRIASRENPRSFGSADGGTISVMSSMEASSRSFFYAVDSVSWSRPFQDDGGMRHRSSSWGHRFGSCCQLKGL